MSRIYPYLAGNYQTGGLLASAKYVAAGGPFGGHPTLATNLKAYYKFDSNANDSTGTYNGTENGSPTYAAGVISNGIDLESTGSDQYVSVNQAMVTGDTGAGSISCWIKPETIANMDIFALGGTGNTATPGIVSLQVRSNNTVRWIWRTEGSSGSIVLIDNAGGTTINTATLYHVVITSDGSTYNLYVNTSDETNLTLGTNNGNWFGDATIDGTSILNIGRLFFDGSATNYFDGIIDELGYWDKQLSTAEISALYNSGSGLTY